MKHPSRLYYLILIAFVLAAISYLIIRWVNYAEEARKIYGAASPERVSPL